jgi:predicted MFS family arabinose efflux permease
MYLVAGAITISWAFTVLFFMDSDPVHAKRLNEREKFIAISRMRSNNAGVRNTHLKKEQIVELLTDLKFWLNVTITLCMYIANGPVSSFVPILLTQMGFSGLNSLVLTIPIGVVIGIGTLACAYLADRLKTARLYIVAACMVPTLLASCLLWNLPQSATGAKLFSIYILGFYNAGYPILMTLQIMNTSGYTKRSLSSAGIFVGYCLGELKRSKRHSVS